MILSLNMCMADIFLRNINFYIVKRVGYRKISLEIREMMYLTFVSQFFSFGIILVLSKANLGFIIKGLGDSRGATDLDKFWYYNVAPVML